MLQDFYRRKSILARVRASSFSTDLEALAAYLQRRGYRSKTLVGYMRGAAHLVSCIEGGQISLHGLTADGFQRFAREHPGRCSCPPPSPEDGNFVAVAPHLFEVMRERHGVASAPMLPERLTPIEATLKLFDAHLRDERGLRDSTRARYLRDLRVTLVEKYGKGSVDVAFWTAQEIRDCVADRAGLSLHAAKALGNALRSFLRFLALGGESVSRLVAAVPATSLPRLRRLPGGLSGDQLSRLVGSIDVSRPIGLRAHAIIECLVSLGLRAGEVAALRLTDIDWRKGTLRVNTSKVRRSDVLPLPPTVGRAVAAYLKRGRPRTADGHVFVRHYMPIGGPLKSHNVSHTVKRALRRAGLFLPSMGAHVLRHTTASRLVRAGVSVKHIADVMRHRDIDTTRIYTKVDWPRLAEAALPWPTAVVS